MLAKELISDLVPPLRTSDTGFRALSLMEIFRISHLPIVNNTEFLGLISDTDIYDLNMADEPIGNHKLSLFSPFVKEDQHIFEVISLISKLKLTIVPVLDEKNNYLGLITLNELLYHFADLSALQNPGAIVILDMNSNDYSLSEISNIIEGNDAKVLGMYISQPSDSMRMEVIVKLNRTDISGIIQTFNRYNYTIKSTYMGDKEMDGFLQDRYDEFMRYLNI
jgi:acetoin utilization protein AcuB